MARALRELRRLDKLKETFIKGAVIEGAYNGRIHCRSTSCDLTALARSPVASPPRSRTCSRSPRAEMMARRFGRPSFPTPA